MDLAYAVSMDDEQAISVVATPAIVNSPGVNGVRVLHAAVRLDKPAATRALLLAGADPTLPDADGVSAVEDAAASIDPVLLEILLAAGANPNTRNAVNGEPVLVSAIRFDRPIQFAALLAAGANPNLADNYGFTPLHRAALVHDAPRVLDLLRSGANPDAASGQGKTFQDYLWTTPTDAYLGEARAARLAIRRWLQLNDVAVTEVSAP